MATTISSSTLSIPSPSIAVVTDVAFRVAMMTSYVHIDELPMIATTNLVPTSPELSPAPPRNFATSAAAAANANLEIVYNDAGPAQVVVPSFSSAAAGGDTAGSAPTFVGADGYSLPFFDATDGNHVLAFVGNTDASRNMQKHGPKMKEGLVRAISHMTYRCLHCFTSKYTRVCQHPQPVALSDSQIFILYFFASLSLSLITHTPHLLSRFRHSSRPSALLGVILHHQPIASFSCSLGQSTMPGPSATSDPRQTPTRLHVLSLRTRVFSIQKIP